MTRVIHTGDTHIGYQQYNAPERRRDFLRAFRQVAEDAIDDDVDAVIHAGDLFHDRRPGLQDLQGTIEVLRRLDDAGVPFLAVVGNHESKRDAQWLDLFADLDLATRLGSEPEVIGDTAFYGLDFVPRSRRDDLEYEFSPPPGGVEHAALVSHGLFEPFAHADWDTETVLAESTVDFDAVLLGDNHHPDTAEVLDTWVTYCGSTERASAAEREERGYNLVRFDDDVAISRRALEGTREFVFVDVDLAEEEGIDRVHERVRERDLDDAVVIVTVEGDGKPITPAAVEEFALDRGATIARVNDRREIESDEDLSVQFADPDEAVRERLRELGLSEAARDIDRAVRDGDLADSNVREEVERRVRSVLEDGDDAFRPAPDESEDATTLADAMADEDGEAETTDEELAAEERDDGPPDDGSTDDESVEGDSTDDESDEGHSTDDESDEGHSTDDESDEGHSTDDEFAEDDSTDDESAEDDPAEAGDQVSMGDFA